MSIGQRIRSRREELGLTQTELAKRMGITSKVSISNVENDKEDLTTTRVKKYADALDCSPAFLMGWTEEADSTISHMKERISGLSGSTEDEDNYFFEKARQDRVFMEYARKIFNMREENRKEIYHFIDYTYDREGQQSNETSAS